ncbi:MAG TPA: HdeD family acid-resistance protein [Methanophagales archaeon]|nr:HdeD family acid-resistance protein [Methanophagales archaeon]
MDEIKELERSILAQESWALAVEGVIALIIGFMILFWPPAVVSIIIVVGAFAFVWGIFALVSSIKADKGRRWVLILEGVCGIIFGLIILFWPGISTAVILWFIMAWLVVSGIFKIAGGFALPKGDGSKGLLIVNGFLALIIGVLLLSLPLLEGLLTMAILIAFFGIFSGITLISLAFVAKSAQGQITA